MNYQHKKCSKYEGHGLIVLPCTIHVLKISQLSPDRSNELINSVALSERALSPARLGSNTTCICVTSSRVRRAQLIVNSVDRAVPSLPAQPGSVHSAATLGSTSR